MALQVEGPAAPTSTGAAMSAVVVVDGLGVGAEVQAAVVRTASRPNAHRNRAFGMVPRC